MADYRVIYTDLLSGTVLGELPVKSLSYGKALNSPGAISVTMPLKLEATSRDVAQTYYDSILADSPIGFYPMDDQSPDPMSDISGNNRHGSYISSPTYRVNGPNTNRIPRAMEYDNSAEHGYVDNATSDAFTFEGNEPFSVSFWVYIASTPVNWRRYVSLDNGSVGWYFLNDSAGKVRFYRQATSAVSVLSDSALSTGAWHHIVGTYDGTSTIRLYVDGVAQADVDTGATASMSSSGIPLTINTNASRASFAGCRMAALVIFDSELSADDIENHYNLGTGAVIETASVPIPATVLPADIVPGGTGLYVERDEVIMWGGILWTTQADVAGDTFVLNGEGFLSYFRRRVIRTTQSWPSGEYQENIASELIDYAQLVAGGDIDIVTSSVSAGKVRNRTYLSEERKSIGDAIEQLAAVDDGFDFDFVSAWVADALTTTFTTTYPNTGRATSYIFELGTNVSVMGVSKDGTTIVSSAEAIGAGLGDEAIIGVATNAALHSQYPRLEAVETFSDIRDYDTLGLHAERRLKRGSGPMESISLKVFADTLPALGAYMVGDLVEVRGTYGFIDIDSTYRIMEIGVAVNEDGAEQITLGLVQKDVF